MALVLSCVLCDSSCEDDTPSRPPTKLSGGSIQASEFIKAHKTFHTFFKYLDVTVPTKNFGWNLLTEPLPFCSGCKNAVDCLLHLEEELERIQEDIQSLVNTFRIKIKGVHRKNVSRLDTRVEDVRRLILRLPKESGPSITSKPSQVVVIKDDTQCNSPPHHDSDDDDDCTFDSVEQKTIKSPSKRSDDQKERPSCIVLLDHPEVQQIVSVEDDDDAEVSEVAHEETVTMDVDPDEIIITSDTHPRGENGPPRKKKPIPRKSRQPKSAKTEITEFSDHQPAKRRVVKKLSDEKFIFEGIEFTKTDTGNFQCSVCPNILKTRDSALCHIKQRHLGEGLGKFLCHVCGKSFDRLVYLKTHEILHTNLRPHLCTTCGRAFAQRANLYNHIKIHEGDLKFQCEVCNKKFLTRGQLRLHMQMHLGIRPFECSLCNKSFVRSYDLVLHMRSHNGVRPFECHLCHSASFYTKYKLNRHLTNVHKEGRKLGIKQSRQEKEKETHNEGFQPQQIQIVQSSEPITFYELI